MTVRRLVAPTRPARESLGGLGAGPSPEGVLSDDHGRNKPVGWTRVVARVVSAGPSPLPGASGAARGGSILASNLTGPPPRIPTTTRGSVTRGRASRPILQRDPSPGIHRSGQWGDRDRLVATVFQYHTGGIPLTVNVAVASGWSPGAVLGSGMFAPSEVSSDYNGRRRRSTSTRTASSSRPVRITSSGSRSPPQSTATSVTRCRS